MTLASLFAPDEAAGRSLTDRRSAPMWLAILAVLMFLPGFFGLPPMDRDEPRFAQATKQMLESGDYVDIRLQDEARNKKPVGIYWLQAAAVRAGAALGVPDALRTLWLYRVPSLLGAVATVLLTFWAGLAFLSRRAAALAAVLVASTILLGVEARLATTDAVLAATVVAAMGALARIYLDGKRPELAEANPFLPAFIFWTAIGVGVLVKGPITPMIPAFASAALCAKERSARWLLRLRPVQGFAWAFAIAAPWLILILFRTHGAFLTDSVGGDMLAKVGSAKESHGAPPGTYLAAFWITAWPMAPFAALAAPFAWRERARSEVAFLLAWLVPAWALFELVPTKLPHYVLPLYPAIALLVAVALDGGSLYVARGWRKLILLLVPAIALLLLATMLGFAFWRGVTSGWPGLVAAPLIVWRVLVFLRADNETATSRRVLDTAILGWLSYIAVYGGLLPVLKPLELSPGLVAARDRSLLMTGCRTLAAATTGYREPSLVFLIGTDLKMTDPAGAADFLAQGSCRIAFVAQTEEKLFADALGSAAGAPVFERVRGFDPGNGRMLAVDAWTRGR